MSERTSDQTETETAHAVIERLRHTLDEWRARIDELGVQLDLAALDVRDEIRKRMEITENVYLATRSRLADLGRDAGSNLSSARQGTEQLLRDLQHAYEAAEAVVRRGRKVP